eukprot:CAMPEP_0180712422 /NCGR_PEP_ID=MMETSP1038_2-20121128/11369_1 /TAXON_ID=632150 /ORGANISM="Azadinium spinosum, Strain 3D9" /LENGTH=58 /DNA_ID=CAMNT_0022744697 /DNA_START=383 /DNA_END=557 /DNA_ORIENTATION=+
MWRMALTLSLRPSQLMSSADEENHHALQLRTCRHRAEPCGYGGPDRARTCQEHHPGHG